MVNVVADVLVVGCLFLAAGSRAGNILPELNLTLTWVSDFEPHLSWAPPQDSSCNYTVFRETKDRDDDEHITSTSPSWKVYTIMKGGFLHLSVKAVCNNSKSEGAFNVSYPEPVKNLTCYIHDSTKSHCSWETLAHVPDLRFYYLLVNEKDDSHSSLQECQLYTYTMDTRTGCSLKGRYHDTIHIVFNGTQNNVFFRNTFKIWLQEDVRPPPLKWTVSKAGDKFNITWIPPDIESVWTFTVNYSECGEEKVKKYPQIKTTRETSTYLNMVAHCPYCMTIKASTKHGETPWSEKKCFDAQMDPNALLYAAIIIPLMLAGLVALTFVCCRKNKENIFPRVPQPRDLLSNIYDNNNKITVRNLYIPGPEEENCQITLVLDPQINKPDF